MGSASDFGVDPDAARYQHQTKANGHNHWPRHLYRRPSISHLANHFP